MQRKGEARACSLDTPVMVRPAREGRSGWKREIRQMDDHTWRWCQSERDVKQRVKDKDRDFFFYVRHVGVFFKTYLFWRCASVFIRGVSWWLLRSTPPPPKSALVSVHGYMDTLSLPVSLGRLTSPQWPLDGTHVTITTSWHPMKTEAHCQHMSGPFSTKYLHVWYERTKEKAIKETHKEHCCISKRQRRKEQQPSGQMSI